MDLNNTCKRKISLVNQFFLACIKCKTWVPKQNQDQNHTRNVQDCFVKKRLVILMKTFCAIMQLGEIKA